METNNKPDFEKMFSSWHPTAAADHLWNKEVIPRDAKIAELAEQTTALAESYSKLQVRLGESQSENQALKSELDKAKHMLNEIDRSLYVGPDLKDKEIMMHYIGVASVIKEEIQDFLKDKR